MDGWVIGEGEKPPIDHADLKRSVVHWEILRLVYNVLLFLIGLSLSFPLILDAGIAPYALGALFYGLIANLFFCLGPLVEIYLLCLGFRIGGLRYVMFIPGLGFSLLLTGAFAAGAAGLSGITSFVD